MAVFRAHPCRPSSSERGLIVWRAAKRFVFGAVLLASVLLVSSCLDCGSNEEAVKRIEALPPQRIEKLAADMKALADAHPTDMAYFDERTGIPPQFADLKPRSIRVLGPQVAIHLAGCVDDKAMIFLFDTGEEQWMDLLPGEVQETKKLWQSRPAVAGSGLNVPPLKHRPLP